MDKGFNDDELADIMNEIESLEHEFADAEHVSTNSIEEKDVQTVSVEAHKEPKVEEVTVQHEVPTAEFTGTEMEEVLEELTEMSVDDVVPEKEIKSYDDNIHHMTKEPSTNSQPSTRSAQTSMSFHVEGEMKLNLNFCVAGQYVSLHVSDQGFEIELAGGAKFTLPVHHVQQGQKVA